MGYEIARAAVAKGHTVTLIAGPTHLAPPKGVILKEVITAQEMLRQVNRFFLKSDAVIMTAAVSDYRPARYYDGKIKKTGKPLVLKLVPTTDILKSIGQRKGRRILIGFALEATNARSNALKKLRSKNLDYVVENGTGSFGRERIDAEIWSPDRLVKRFKSATKKEIGNFIINLL
jgi:phosphopantothenoylcysteine decarboxylase/phosphopantothenate--cysteine ligase